jgi:hypothetical protein
LVIFQLIATVRSGRVIGERRSGGLKLMKISGTATTKPCPASRAAVRRIGPVT